MLAPAFRRERIEHDATGHDAPGAIIPQHNSVGVQDSSGAIQQQMHEARFSGSEIPALEHAHAARDRGSAQMGMDARTVAKLPTPRNADPRVQPRGRRVQRWVDQPIATAQLCLLDPRAGYRQRATVAGFRGLCGAVLHVDAAHACG